MKPITRGSALCQIKSHKCLCNFTTDLCVSDTGLVAFIHINPIKPNPSHRSKHTHERDLEGCYKIYFRSKG